jgi:hypothetical protein
MTHLLGYSTGETPPRGQNEAQQAQQNSKQRKLPDTENLCQAIKFPSEQGFIIKIPQRARAVTAFSI